MKKILILSLSYYPRFVGGAEVAIKEITDRIPASECEFHMITLRYDSLLPKREQVGRVMVHRIGFAVQNPTVSDLRTMPFRINKMFFQIYAALYALYLHKKENFSVVWAMMAHSAGIPASIFKTVHPQVRYVLTLQEGDTIEHILSIMRPVMPVFVRSFTKADVIQAISKFLGTWAGSMGFKGQLEIIPNGVDVAKFSRPVDTEVLHALKRKVGKTDDETYIVTSSRLVAKNAVDDVIRSLPLLPDSVKFLVLGTGPDQASLSSLAEELGVQGRVIFCGHVDHDDIPAYLALSDIFVRPSLSEGMGNSFIEAMAAGIPIIATQEGGIADFLFDPVRNPNHEPTGRAVSPRNPGEIAAAIRSYLENPATTRIITNNAQKLVKDKYEWGMVVHNMRERVFRTINEKKN